MEGAILTTRTVLPLLRRSAGVVVMLSSVAAHIGSPGNAVYTASKFAIDGFAESLAYEVADFGVRVRPVQIGHVSTGLITQFPPIDDSSPYSSFGRAAQARLRDIGSSPETAITPSDVASSVLRIVDDALFSPATFLRIPLAEEQRSFIQRRHQTSDQKWFDDYKSGVDKYR